MDYYLITIGNIHCESCGAAIKKTLQPYLQAGSESGSGWDIAVSIPERSILVTFPSSEESSSSNASNKELPSNLEEMADALAHAGFEVLEIEKLTPQEIEAQNSSLAANSASYIYSLTNSPLQVAYTWTWKPVVNILSYPFKQWTMQRTHRQYCQVCRANHAHFKHSPPHQEEKKESPEPKDADVPQDSDKDETTTKWKLPSSIFPSSLKGKRRSSSFSDISDDSTVVATPLSVTDEPLVVCDDDKSGNSMYKATFSIGGMSCSSCSNAITSGVQSLYPDILGPDSGTGKFAVDLMNHCAFATFPQTGEGLAGAEKFANQISAAIEDLGYDSEVVEVVKIQGDESHTTLTTQPKNEYPKTYKVIASIGGMTCSSCANSISENTLSATFENQLKNTTLRYTVEDAKISILDHAATFIIKVEIQQQGDISEVSEKDELTDIENFLQDAVESSGFDFELDTIKKVEPAKISTKDKVINDEFDFDKPQSPKTVTLSVSGMFCRYVIFFFLFLFCTKSY